MVRLSGGSYGQRGFNHEKGRFQAVFEDTFPGALGTPWDLEISARSFFGRSATPAASVAGDKGGIGPVVDRHSSIVHTPGARFSNLSGESESQPSHRLTGFSGGKALASVWH